MRDRPEGDGRDAAAGATSADAARPSSARLAAPRGRSTARHSCERRVRSPRPTRAEAAAGVLVAALEAAIGGIESLGKATTGEKTMLDALVPAVTAGRAAAAVGADARRGVRWRWPMPQRPAWPRRSRCLRPRVARPTSVSGPSDTRIRARRRRRSSSVRSPRRRERLRGPSRSGAGDPGRARRLARRRHRAGCCAFGPSTRPRASPAPVRRPRQAVSATVSTRALGSAASELAALADQLSQRVGEEVGSIFEAQALFARDPGIVDPALALVDEGIAADEAILRATDAQAERLASVDDDYFRERAADVRDVGRRVAAHLRGESPPELWHRDGHPAIVLAGDLDPSAVATLRRELVGRNRPCGRCAHGARGDRCSRARDPARARAGPARSTTSSAAPTARSTARPVAS